MKYLIPELQRVTHMDTDFNTTISYWYGWFLFRKKKKLTTSKLNNTHIQTSDFLSFKWNKLLLVWKNNKKSI